MESYYNRYISNKCKSLATSNKHELASEGSLLWCSFDAPLMLLWCSFDGSKVARSGFLDEPSGKAEREGDSEWFAPANVCGKGDEAGFVAS